MNKLVEKAVEQIPTDTFTDTNLRILLKGSPASRYGLVKRSVRSGQLIRIKRGLYTLAERYRRRRLDLFEIAQKIYGPSYISLESALYYHGWIPEAVYTVTSACVKRSKEIKTPLGLFSFTHIPSNNFFAGVERISSSNGIFLIASPWRALLDYIYVYKKDWVGLKPVIESLRIDAVHFQNVDFRLLEEMKEATRSVLVKKFIDSVKKEILS
jgi:hypothetical protein